MEDIALLGLGVDSGEVRRATGDLDKFSASSKAAELGAKAFRAAMGIAVVGITAFGFGINGAVKRLEELDRRMKQVDTGLRNSGNTARTSALEISRWAENLEYRTGRAAEEVMAVATNLASFGFGRSEFFRSLELANDMAAAWGGDLRQNLEGLARALDDPLNGMAMLSKRGIKLTEEQKELAAAFLDSNNKVAAQGVVFEALEAQVKGVAEAGFGGLSRALSRARNAWEGAFEDLVRGTGQTGDLRDSLVTLAETVSSPEFIRSVVGFAGVLVQGMTQVANAVVWAWGKMQEFFSWLDSKNPANMSSANLQQQLDEQRAILSTREDKLANGGLYGDKGGIFGSSIGAADQIAFNKRKIAELERELAARSDPAQFNLGATFETLKGANTFDDTASMWRFLSPGTMFGQDSVDPYQGMSFADPDKLKEAEKAAQQLQQTFNNMFNDVRPLFEDINDPFVEMQSNLDKLDALLNAGQISWEQYAQGVQSANLIATSSVLGSVGQITGILAGAFRENKLLAAANAAINTAEGVTKALAQGGMFAWPTAIAIGAAGAAQVASIMSASPGNAKTAPVGNAPTPAAAQPSAAALNLTIRGSGYINVDEIADQIAASVADGGQQPLINIIRERAA